MAHRARQNPMAGALPALFLAMLLLPGVAAAQDAVGRVLVASGGVTAVRDGESSRGLGRGDALYEGDVIRTGARGRIQMRLDDGGLVDLEPASRFEIDTYEGGEGDGSVVMSFLRGAMRTITGAIGMDDGESYRLQTTVATIGVRGTAYALRYCDEACIDAGGEPGIYGRVDEGEIVATGPSGDVRFGAGDYFFLPETGDPRRIVVPPEGVLDGDDDGGGGGGSDETDDVPIRPVGGDSDDAGGLSETRDDLFDPGFESGEDTQLEESADDEPAPRPGTAGDVLFGGAFVGGENGALFESTLFVSPTDGEARLDGDGNVVGADFPASGFVDASGMTLAESGTTTIFLADPDVEITWGRWEGALAIEGEEDADGGDSFAFAYTDSANLTPSSALSGSASYTSNLPSPLGIGTDGSLWQVTSADISVSFGDSSLLNGFLLDQTNGPGSLGLLSPTGGDVDGANGTVSFSNVPFQGSSNYTGAIEGVFVGSNGEALIIRYDLDEDSGGNTITGIQIIGPPS